jgi:beta-aspartyl-peptidase (threonine type)
VSPLLIVHAGASKVPEDLTSAYLDGVREAANYGFVAMMERKNARDGVEAAIIAMENNPNLSAGVGGALNLDGKVQCDAGIMEGRTMKSGTYIFVLIYYCYSCYLLSACHVNLTCK